MLFAFTAVFALLGSVLGVAQGVPILYDFGEVAGDVLAERNDDGSTGFSLNVGFPVFGVVRLSGYVNTNGDISFTNPISDYTPVPFHELNNFNEEEIENQEIIAPFWADIDTDSGNGTIWFRETQSQPLLDRAEMEIRAAFDAHPAFSPISLFIATWSDVQHFTNEIPDPKTNTFQCVLATDGVITIVIFLYEEITWTTGDASDGVNGFGGTPALVGLSAGDQINFYNVSGSLTPEILNISMDTNVELPGVFMFQVDSQEIRFPGCNMDDNARVFISPRLGSVLGGTAVEVFGPCLYPDDTLECIFAGTAVPATYINADSALCVSPALSVHGRITFTFTMSIGGSEVYRQSTSFYSLSIEDILDVDVSSDGPLLVARETVTVTWNPQSLLPDALNVPLLVNISMYVVPPSPNQITLVRNVANTGSASITVPILPEEGVSPVVLRVTTDLYQQTAGIWGSVLIFANSRDFRSICNSWSSGQSPNIRQDLVERLPACPPTVSRARRDSRFTADTGVRARVNGIYRSTAAVCYRQTTFTSANMGSSQQCCYDDNDNLISGFGIGAGSSNLVATGGSFEHSIQHALQDVVPYTFCCFGTSPNCRSYFDNRPSSTGRGYRLRPPACVYGDPHMITLDGQRYTFNGKGEFILIQTTQSDSGIGSFRLQGRMTNATNSTGGSVNATVFTAIAAKQYNSDTVQFSAGPRGIDALVNGDIVQFVDLAEQAFSNVIVAVTDSGLSARFSDGAYIEATAENQIISILFVSLPDHYQGVVEGLMGNYNGDASDDLQPRFSEGPRLPIDPSSLMLVHYEFGLSWIVNNEQESLFTYPPGRNYFSYQDFTFVPAFTPAFTDPTLQAMAEAVCGSDTACLYDVMVTENLDFGRATRSAVQEYDETVQLSDPVVCNPPCVNGSCVANDVCNCGSAFTGTLCDEPVFDPCPSNPCVGLESCVLLAGSYLCVDCVFGPSSPICDTLGFVRCLPDIDATYTITWPETAGGIMQQVPCAGNNTVGIATRFCSINGTWSPFVDASNCTSAAFNEIMAMAEAVFAPENPDLDAVDEVVAALANVTDPANTAGTQLPGDLQTANQIISQAITALSDANTTDADVRAFNDMLFRTIDNVLDVENEAGWENLQVSEVGSEMLLQSCEDYGRYATIALSSDTIATQSNENITLTGSNIELQAVRVAMGTEVKDIVYMEEKVDATIPADLLLEKGAADGDVTVVNIYLKTIDQFLPTSGLSDNSTPGTPVISTQIFSGDVRVIERNRNFVEFRFTTDVFDGQNVTKPKCAFFDFSDSVENSAWKKENVETVSVTEIERDDNNIQFEVVCRSYHFTSFAVLVDVSGGLRNISAANALALDIISYIGCGISIVCLLLTVIFLLVLVGREMLKKVYFLVHFNLAIALLLALVLFLAGVTTAARNRGACVFVAVGLHYLFTAVFCWMLCEGVMLYLMLVVVFSKLSSKWWFFLLLGWATPIIPVVITFGVRHQEYGNSDVNGDGLNDYCWLSVDDPSKGTIWGFVAPMLAIILINIFFLIMALRALFRVRSDKRKDSTHHYANKENIALVKQLCCATVVLLPLLGLTWVFGLLVINRSLLVFAYLFTIFNSLQGLFIFIFHVLRNEKIWGRITKKIERRRLRSTLKRSTRLSSVSQPAGMRRDITGKNKDRMKDALISISEDKQAEQALSFHNPLSSVDEDGDEPWPDSLDQKPEEP